MADLLPINSGDDVTLELTYTDINNAPVDITGMTSWMCIKKRLKDRNADALYISSWTDHTDPEAGITSVTIADTVTQLWEPGEYFWQTRLIDSGGSIATADDGPCTIIQLAYDNQ